jgi:hypothetical protein
MAVDHDLSLGLRAAVVLACCAALAPVTSCSTTDSAAAVESRAKTLEEAGNCAVAVEFVSAKLDDAADDVSKAALTWMSRHYASGICVRRDPSFAFLYCQRATGSITGCPWTNDLLASAQRTIPAQPHDPGLLQCMSLQDSGSGPFFENHCGTDVRLEFYCRDQATGHHDNPGEATLAPDALLGPFLCPQRSDTIAFAACPASDGIWSSDGRSATWDPNTPFTCRRFD